MPKTSAGIILYRYRGGEMEVLLVHPGGPFWANKDLGIWSIPKGELHDDQLRRSGSEASESDLLATAKREFEEELGFAPPANGYIPLGSIVQRSGKIVHAWAGPGDCDTGAAKSNTTKIEWPPRSGKFIDIPEVDRAEFFSIEEAKKKINPAQIELLERLVVGLSGKGAETSA